MKKRGKRLGNVLKLKLHKAHLILLTSSQPHSEQSKPIFFVVGMMLLNRYFECKSQNILDITL